MKEGPRSQCPLLEYLRVGGSVILRYREECGPCCRGTVQCVTIHDTFFLRVTPFTGSFLGVQSSSRTCVSLGRWWRSERPGRNRGPDLWTKSRSSNG